MARQARQHSQSGVYHVMLRGIDQVQLFYDDDDRQAFLQRLLRLRSDGSFLLYAYALMGNHVHLLLREQADPISTSVKRLTIGYSHWFNKKYDRQGYLFQGRFKSQPVDDDAFLLAAFRYIHLNPVKIGLSIDSWTSYRDYLEASDVIDTDLILSLIAPRVDDRATRLARFFDATPQLTDPAVLGDTQVDRSDDARAIDLIKDVGQLDSCPQLAQLDKARRDDIIARLKAAGLTIRQISRLTGINRGIVQKARSAPLNS